MRDDPPLRNAQPLRLHVPQPRFRPGDTPDFSHIPVPAAGEAFRPDETCAAGDTHPLCTHLVRVLDEDGRAVGPWDPKLGPDTLRRMLRDMQLVRVYDDRMYRAQRQGKTSFYMKSTGEEAVAVAATHALDRGDMCFPTYRQQGILVARDYPLHDMMCQIYSNRGDKLNGRQLPVMYSSPEHGFFTISGNLGTQLPQGVGWAMASAIKGETAISASWTGEGATAEGDFHSAMTFAAVYRAPAIINIVNNQWAISTFQGIAGGENATFAQRAVGYGVAGLRVDGNDALAVYAATRWAADRARANAGPTLIELFTYRAEGHSTSDDPTGYRPKGEGQEWPLGDPIARLKAHLVGLGEWDEERNAAQVEELSTLVRQTQREAEALGTLSDVHFHNVPSMFDDVFAELPWHLREQRAEALAETEGKA